MSGTTPHSMREVYVSPAAAGSEAPAVSDAALKGMLGELVANAQREGRLGALRETSRALVAIQETLGNMTELPSTMVENEAKKVMRAQGTVLASLASWISDTIAEMEDPS